MTQALQLPRMTTAERDALTPVGGMMIYNTDTWTIQLCLDDTTWIESGF